MANKRNLVLGLVLAFLVGGVVGLGIGGYIGFRLAAASVLDTALQKDAGGIQSDIAALRLLRAGQTEQAVDLVESRMDDDLIIFDLEEPYPGISRETLSEIDRAIQEAIRYRSENPRKSNRPHVDAMVTNLFKKRSRESGTDIKY